MNQAPTLPAVTLPFGKHKDKLPGEVPTGYLLWMIRECKLSSGLRLDIGDELRRRNVEAPAPPPLKCPPRCKRCPSEDFSVEWQEDRRGRRCLRATCSCDLFLCFLPLIQPWIDAANEVASPAPLLDALIRLEGLGIDLQSDGKTVWFFGDDRQRVPPDLHALIRQCSHQLARMIGRR